MVDPNESDIIKSIMAKTIWLIRHGESAANAGHATESAHSIPLTERGHKQAAAVVQALPTAPDLIVVSSYHRARQTADPTITAYPSAKVEEWPVEEFTYLSLKGATPTTAADRRPFVQEYWNQCDPEHCDGPGAESFLDFMVRVRGIIGKLKRCKDARVAIFSHGQFIRAVMWLLLTGRREINSTAMKEFEHFLLAVPFPNCAIVQLRLDYEDLSLGPVSVDHLD